MCFSTFGGRAGIYARVTAQRLRGFSPGETEAVFMRWLVLLLHVCSTISAINEGTHGNPFTKPAPGKRFHWNQGNPGRRLLRHPDGARSRELSYLRHDGPSFTDPGFWHGQTGRR